jgi:hypothetical protein
MKSMVLHDSYRWCNTADGGGGIVIAASEEDGIQKLVKKYGNVAENFIVWPWVEDEFFDEDNQDVLDIYG